MDSLTTTLSSRRARCWRVPPPLTRGSELLEGAEILSEVSGETAVLLWKTMRNVMLWAASTAQEQAALFTPGARERRLAEIETAGVDPALRASLETLTGVMDGSDVPRDTVALACRQVAQWADARGASATSLAFSQAAAVTCPADPCLALAVGRIARQRAEHSRSESWLRRAVMLARQTSDWETYALAYLGLGNLFVQRGSYPLARRAHLKGLRAARRKGLREVAAQGYHDLLVVEMECGNARRAEECATAALRAYGKGHARLPALAHDTAVLWVSNGEFARALPVFQALLPHFEGAPSLRLLVLGNVARAAAGSGRSELFESARRRIWEETEEGEGEHRAQALLNLARGAVQLGLWAHAEEAVERARRNADARGEAQIQFELETVLDAIRRRRAVESREEKPETVPAQGAEADALLEGFLRSLSRATAGV